MALQEKLDDMRRQFEATAPPDALAVMHRATDDLLRSGIMEDALKKGDTSQPFRFELGALRVRHRVYPDGTV